MMEERELKDGAPLWRSCSGGSTSAIIVCYFLCFGRERAGKKGVVFVKNGEGFFLRK